MTVQIQLHVFRIATLYFIYIYIYILNSIFANGIDICALTLGVSVVFLL